jgi:endonuclease/exonuclease/phosphatase family metal-dependent hydrolase
VDVPGSRTRDDWLAQLGDADAHRRLLAELACLHQVDVHAADAPAVLSGWVRVAAWNVQRGWRPDALAATLRKAGAELCLLSELDAGMARTQNLDTTACIARDLGAGSVFAVEFVELGLGDEHERRAVAGASAINERGLHGNAVIATAPLEDPAVLRLPDVGLGWFAADSTQPRVGGRMAVLATVRLDGTAVQIASTHLENRSDAAHRAEQMEALLRAVDERGNGSPAVVGGDCNTSGTDFAELADRGRVRAMRVEDPTRFTWPVAYEPLFEVARAYGYSWTDANVAAPTTEHDGRGLPDHVPIRLDWLFVRGLVARRPAVVPAGGLSDHHMVSVGVRLP